MFTAAELDLFHAESREAFVNKDPKAVQVGNRDATEREFQSLCAIRAASRLLARKGLIDKPFEFPENLNAR